MGIALFCAGVAFLIVFVSVLFIAGAALPISQIDE